MDKIAIDYKTVQITETKIITRDIDVEETQRNIDEQKAIIQTLNSNNIQEINNHQEVIDRLEADLDSVADVVLPAKPISINTDPAIQEKP